MKLLSMAGRYYAMAAILLCTPLMAQEVDLESDAGKAGYSVGVNIGMNIAGQMPMEELNVPSLLRGVSDGISGELQMSEEEVMTALQAFSLAQQDKMNAEAAAAQEADMNFLANNGQRAEVTTTASGLQYEILEEGEAGASSPSASDTVTVHYHGTLIDGTVFDSSVERGDPTSFPLNGVIPGWTEGVQLMKVGDKFRFFVPPQLAYGESGAGGVIGPNATLIFDVELLEIE
jgi:FKBP-type peptidyl-prolyl cis-trans isomerase FklB